MRKRRDSFTLMEMIVVMSVIIILGGILLPQVNRVITEARVSKAKAELEHIKAAMLAYKEDTGELPPTAATYAEGDIATSGVLDDLLVTDSATGWDGPYLDQSVLTDPWGNAYQYADNDGVAGAISYLLSHGPDEDSDGSSGLNSISPTVEADDIYVVVYNDGT